MNFSLLKTFYICVCLFVYIFSIWIVCLFPVKEKSRYKSLMEEAEWGWGMMKWTEDKAGRGWGVKVKQRGEQGP